MSAGPVSDRLRNRLRSLESRMLVFTEMSTKAYLSLGEIIRVLEVNLEGEEKEEEMNTKFNTTLKEVENTINEKDLN